MPLRVIIVDDSPITRIMIRDMLESFDHQVVAETETLADTVKAYLTYKPDLVTLDLSLTKENGLTILKALREADPRAKVLIVSGNSQNKVREQIVTSGAAGFLSKPFDCDELMKAVKAITAA